MCAMVVKEVARFICTEGWTELTPDEILTDITGDPGLYYPEYLQFMKRRGGDPLTRAGWKKAAASG